MIGALFNLALRQALTRRKLLLLAILALIPLGFAALQRNLDPTAGPEGILDGVFNGVLLSIALPLIVMTLATGAFGNEIEDRTLSLIAAKPIPRAAVVLAKLAATVAVAGPLTAVVAALVVLMALDGGAARGAAVAAASALIGVAAYAAVFTWAGLVTSRALAFGLVYALLWEGLLASQLEGLRYLSVRAYMLGSLAGMDAAAFAPFSSNAIELPAALGGATLMTALFFLLTLRRLSRMDIP